MPCPSGTVYLLHLIFKNISLVVFWLSFIGYDVLAILPLLSVHPCCRRSFGFQGEAVRRRQLQWTRTVGGAFECCPRCKCIMG